MSPACEAPAEVIPAAIKFVVVLPGANAPNVNWVTLPIPPMGLMSVSPVERTAIMASTQDIATATMVIQTGMSKTDFETNAAKAAPATKPPIHHMAGIWSLGSSMSETSFAEEPPVKVLRMDFHDNARLPKASITIKATQATATSLEAHRRSS